MTDTRRCHSIIARMSSTLLLFMLLSPAAHADILDVINKLRAQRCGVREPLRASPQLDQVARLLSRGAQLEDARREARYASTRLASLMLTNTDDERSLEQMLGQQLCGQLAAPGLRELGAYRYGGVMWIALGEPFVPPDPRDREAISERVLQLTNAARSQPRRCGNKLLPAAAPLTLDPLLAEAALEHSQDMAAHGYMDHTAPDGSTPAERVSRTGYVWSEVGENLASGDSTAEGVVAGWLQSPRHCENLMGSQFRHMGIAFGVNLAANGRVYWTQVFATPRSRPAQ
jgi:uncharacterized protein YkwD